MNEDQIRAEHEQALREMEEPKDGISPTPVSFLLACFVLAAWSGYYIADNHGGWSGVGYSERVLATGGPAAAPVDPKVLGKEVFSACVQCHQADGKGLAGTFPPLAASEFVTGDERRLAAILLGGINGKLTVNGVTYEGEMPAWGSYFGDEELAAVMTYIRSAWGNQAAPVKKETVTKVRAELGGGKAWSADSLAEFAAKKAP